MKHFLLSATAITLTAGVMSLTAAAPARADANAAFCLESSGITGQDRACNYYTMAQCQATMQGLPGQCIPNPRLASPNDTNRRSYQR